MLRKPKKFSLLPRLVYIQELEWPVAQNQFYSLIKASQISQFTTFAVVIRWFLG